jgi:two-component system nitrogen regulation response regulator GlnG
MSKSAIADISTAAGSGRDVEAPGLVPALTIVSHPLAGRAGERCLLEAVTAGRAVELSRNAPHFARPGRALGTPPGDPFVSRRPIRFIAGPDGGAHRSGRHTGRRERTCRRQR